MEPLPVLELPETIGPASRITASLRCASLGRADAPGTVSVDTVDDPRARAGSTCLVVRPDTLHRFDFRLLVDFRESRRCSAAIGLRFVGSTGSNTRYGLDDCYQTDGCSPDPANDLEGYVGAGLIAVAGDCLGELRPASFEDLMGALRRSVDGCLGVPLARCPENFGEGERNFGVPALFLDRDGVINEDSGYVHRIDDVRFVPGIFEFVREVERRGYRVVVVTNQSGVARGYYTIEDVERLHDWMREEFARRGILVTGFKVCPYHERGTIARYARHSLYRKPEPGMVLEAAEEYGIDLSRSIVVGDKPTDRIRLPYLRNFILAGGYTGDDVDAASLGELLELIP